MIIDSFCFCNELDLLDIRLNELDCVVDKFIIVEANKTQSLLPKPFNFENNKSRYSKFLEKIVYIKVEDCPNNDKDLWTMEHFQRNCVSRGLQKISPNSTDHIMISDMDEIPRAEAIKYVLNNNILDSHKIVVMDCDFYAYYMNLKATYRNWVGASITTADLYSIRSPQEIKDNKNIYPKVSNGGWHFSWLGGAEKVWEKAHNCIEPYDKSQIPPKEEYIKYFEEYVKKDKKCFIRTESLQESPNEEFAIVKLDDSYPEWVLNNYDKFSQYFLKY